MNSVSPQNELCNITDDEAEEFCAIQTRQRTAAKQIKRKNISTRIPDDEIEPHLESTLLGENGLGLTAEEFNTLPNSERRQLLEAVLQSKEEYKLQESKTKPERLDVHTETSTHKKTASYMPVKMECSIPLSRVFIDTAITHSVKSSLSKLGLKRRSEVTAEDEVHMGTTIDASKLKKLKFNEDSLAESEASVAEPVNTEHRNIDSEKCKLTADKPKFGVLDFVEKNEESGLRKKVCVQDCSGVQESNSLDLLTPEKKFQPRTRNGEGFSKERETSCRCLLLESYDNNQMFASSASLNKAETTEEKLLDCPGSLTSCRLIRKYRVQAIDKRPLFKLNGLDLEARVRVIYDYYTECEIKRFESDFKIASRNQWGKPVAIELDKGRVSSRNLKPRGDVTETEQTNDKSLHKNENQTSDCDVYSAFNENVEIRKRLVLPVDQIPSSTVSSTSLDVSLDLDDLLTQEDIESRLRKSRQTKIGGGLVEDEGAKIARRKIPKRAIISTASDDETDPDFIPGNKKKRVRVDSERSQKSEKPRKKRLGLVKSTGKHSRKTEGILEGCKAAEWNEIGSAEGELEAQESRNLAGCSSWQDAGKCQTTTAPKYNANISHTHSSTSLGDFYETKSAVVSSIEKHNFVNDTLMNRNTVNNRDLDQCQINADLEDSLSSSLIFGRNSSFKNDTKQQVFPVFQKLVRPCLRESERSTDTRNIPSSSNNSNSKQNEDNADVFSGDSSEGDDCNLEKSTKKKKLGGQHSAFAKTYQKKKVKTAVDQQMIISFAAPSLRIPKVTQLCPLCQKDFPLSSLEEHVQQCVQLDDERNSNPVTSDRS